jgi:hypothetical protein
VNKEIQMDTFIARTALVTSDIRSGAHADGYDYADYQADPEGWAKQVWDVAGTNLEGILFLNAAQDYREHLIGCVRHCITPMPKGKYCEHHVAGQIDRAIEIADGI